jgi:hypothetical protein
MAKEAKFYMIENVGGVEENASTSHIQTFIATSSFLDIKSVHLQTSSNVPNSNILQLETVEAQAII